MTMSARDRRAITLGSAALAVLGAYFGVIEPLYGRYQRLVDGHREAAEKIRHNVEERQQLAARAEQVAAKEAEVGPLLIDKTYSEQITAVGSRIVAAAGECQVQIQGATPTSTTPWMDTWSGPDAVGSGPSLEQATINIEAQSEWENAFKFMAALYRIEGVFSVEQMEFSGDPKRGGQLRLRLAVSVLMKASAEGRR